MISCKKFLVLGILLSALPLSLVSLADGPKGTGGEVGNRTSSFNVKTFSGKLGPAGNIPDFITMSGADADKIYDASNKLEGTQFVTGCDGDACTKGADAKIQCSRISPKAHASCTIKAMSMVDNAPDASGGTQTNAVGINVKTFSGKLGPDGNIPDFITITGADADKIYDASNKLEGTQFVTGCDGDACTKEADIKIQCSRVSSNASASCTIKAMSMVDNAPDAQSTDKNPQVVVGHAKTKTPVSRNIGSVQSGSSQSEAGAQ